MKQVIDIGQYKDATGCCLNAPPITGTQAIHKDRGEFVIMGTRFAVNHKGNGYDLLVAGVCEEKLDHYLTFYREWDRFHIPARPTGCIRVKDELAGHSWELFYDRVGDVYLPDTSKGLKFSRVLTAPGFPLAHLVAPAMSEVFGMGRLWPTRSGRIQGDVHFARATEIGCDGQGMFTVIAYAPADLKKSKGGDNDKVVRTEDLLRHHGFNPNVAGLKIQ